MSEWRERRSEQTSELFLPTVFMMNSPHSAHVTRFFFDQSGNVVPSTSGSVPLLDEGASTTSAQPDLTVAAISGVNYKVR